MIVLWEAFLDFCKLVLVLVCVLVFVLVWPWMNLMKVLLFIFGFKLGPHWLMFKLFRFLLSVFASFKFKVESKLLVLVVFVSIPLVVVKLLDEVDDAKEGVKEEVLVIKLLYVVLLLLIIVE